MVSVVTTTTTVTVTAIRMGNSDFFILEALKRIGDQRCTYEDIIKASQVKCDVSTVYRALVRLQAAGRITQVSRTKHGCVYEVKKEETPDDSQ
jgi:Fe2+ or Zn2+ uptake regulation protein